MSWSMSVPPTPKEKFGSAVNKAATSPPTLAAEPAAQHKAAKSAVKKLAKTCFEHATSISASVNGHACTDGQPGSDSLTINLVGS